MIRINARTKSTPLGVVITEQNRVPREETAVAHTRATRQKTQKVPHDETNIPNKTILHSLQKLTDEGAPSTEPLVDPLSVSIIVDLGGETSSETVEMIDTGKHHCCVLL